MIRVLGAKSVREMLPMVTTSLTDVASLLGGELGALAGDLAALQADLAALQAEAAQILADITSATSIATELQRRLLAGPTALADAIKSAIEQITTGAALLALQQTLATGLATLLASVDAALKDAVSKVTSLTTRHTALLARVAGMIARIQAIGTRLLALRAMLDRVNGLVNLLGGATAQAFIFEGTVNQFGSDVSAQVEPEIPGGSTSQAFAFILVGGAGASVAPLTRLFAGLS